MSPPFKYSTSFTLDKHYLTECYEETALLKRSLSAYRRAFILMAVAIFFIAFSELDIYISVFIFILGVIDAASIYFHKAWWLARQLISGSYNSEVHLSIDEESIKTKSPHASSAISWTDIAQIQQSPKGFTLYHNKGKSYLSNSTLTSEAKAYIQKQTLEQTS